MVGANKKVFLPVARVFNLLNTCHSDLNNMLPPTITLMPVFLCILSIRLRLLETMFGGSLPHCDQSCSTSTLWSTVSNSRLAGSSAVNSSSHVQLPIYWA